MPSGPGIWGFRTRFNIEIVGAQSQTRVRERTVRIEYYSQRSKLARIIKRRCDRMNDASLSIKRSVVV